MKTFAQPEINVIKFAVEDVITVSGETEATALPTPPPMTGLIGNCA